MGARFQRARAFAIGGDQAVDQRAQGGPFGGVEKARFVGRLVLGDGHGQSAAGTGQQGHGRRGADGLAQEITPMGRNPDGFHRFSSGGTSRHNDGWGKSNAGKRR